MRIPRRLFCKIHLGGKEKERDGRAAAAGRMWREEAQGKEKAAGGETMPIGSESADAGGRFLVIAAAEAAKYSCLVMDNG